MWLFCDRGFYSVVQKQAPGVVHEDQLLVRARTRDDLVRLCQDLEISSMEIQATPQADYPYRLVLHRDDFALWVGSRIGALKYPNFKSFILDSFGSFRERIYARVWAACTALREDDYNG